MMEWRHLIGIGALAAGLAVAIGAFGAHALKGSLGTQELQWYKTGFEYHIIHSLALICLGLFASRINHGLVQWSGLLFGLGILLFSGSLYFMALGLPRYLAILTPFGGLAFLLGWGLFAFSALKPLS